MRVNVGARIFLQKSRCPMSLPCNNYKSRDSKIMDSVLVRYRANAARDFVHPNMHYCAGARPASAGKVLL